MLAKLIKYDLKYICKLLAIYGAIIVAGVIIYLLTDVENPTGIIQFIHEFIGGACFGLSFGLFFSTFTRVWVRFQKNLYGDESYLTHTLPVTKSQLLASKTIASIITLVISLVILAFCLVLIGVGFSGLGDLNETLKSQGYNIFGIGALLSLTIILQQTFIMLCGFSGILVGHRKNEHRTAWSWLAGGGIYIIANLIIVGLVMIWGLFDNNIHNFIFSGESQSLTNIANINQMMIGVDIMYLLITSSIYFISQKTLNRGVDVE